MPTSTPQQFSSGNSQHQRKAIHRGAGRRVAAAHPKLRSKPRYSRDLAVVGGPQDACPADSGVSLQQEEEGAVNDLIDRLEEVGQHQVMPMNLQMHESFLAA